MFKTSPTHKIINQMEVGQIFCLDSKSCKYEGMPDLLVETIIFQSIVKCFEDKSTTQLTHSNFSREMMNADS